MADTPSITTLPLDATRGSGLKGRRGLCVLSVVYSLPSVGKPTPPPRPQGAEFKQKKIRQKNRAHRYVRQVVAGVMFKRNRHRK